MPKKQNLPFGFADPVRSLPSSRQITRVRSDMTSLYSLTQLPDRHYSVEDRAGSVVDRILSCVFSPVRDTDHATRAHKTRRRRKGTCPLQISRFRIFSLHGLPASPPPCARPRSIRVQAARARVRPHTTTRNQRWRQHGRPEPPPSSSMLPHVRAIRHTPHAPSTTPVVPCRCKRIVHTPVPLYPTCALRRCDEPNTGTSSQHGWLTPPARRATGSIQPMALVLVRCAHQRSGEKPHTTFRGSRRGVVACRWATDRGVATRMQKETHDHRRTPLEEPEREMLASRLLFL